MWTGGGYSWKDFALFHEDHTIRHISCVLHGEVGYTLDSHAGVRG